MAAIRNRDLPITERAEELHEIHDKEGGVKQEILPRTGQFRYKNKIWSFFFYNQSVQTSLRAPQLIPGPLNILQVQWTGMTSQEW